jgi:putative transposase
LIQLEEAKSKKIPFSDFSSAIGFSSRTLFYWKKENTSDSKNKMKRKPPSPANKLTNAEKKLVVSALLRPTWSDLSPREIYYKLLDEEATLVASVSSFYRIAKEKQILTLRSKTKSGTKLNREKPHLMALKPNEIWSWDVTQIFSTTRSEKFYLYVIIDIWSRYVVGWRLENHEQTLLAIDLWKEALQTQMISGQGLINHKDNGSIMTSKEMIKFVRDAQMIDSYSRAGVSDDNPFSESLFRTIKYFRDFPVFFEDLKCGQDYFKSYFHDYNYTHRHSGIQFLIPASRHYGEEEKILSLRNETIQEFHKKNSHRYSSKPKRFHPILEVNIN